MTNAKVVWPSNTHLSSYIHALERKWHPNEAAAEQASSAELNRIHADPEAFLKRLVDRGDTPLPVTLSDGRQVARLPGYKKWIWDGEFCGVLSFVWQKGTEDLPDYCPGHIGVYIVPWKRGLGYASKCLGAFLLEIDEPGICAVTIETNFDNTPCRRAIERNKGRLIANQGDLSDQSAVRYRIGLGQ
ncbi:GNAT family N-acetyltransferase [Xylophilus ampelinus]|uniref:Putative acetyltransferase n=1 Tax=Xylophilus ampelinus TaxID=54067 RepID=A0A318SH53_9BURK|nr:GNAT family N-acetyltransferase [Xylophilus ampelinus]MCS4511887.1 GNAT family N-acetyltransferase [Xylophilus ampelinus]PYE73010.1 putative acetyltransferase [Xylophilus ampelinus]